MSLYQKYRPTSFNALIGDHEGLETLLSSKDCPHAFLFTGPSGVGKTTSARILATMLGANDMDIQEYNSSDKNGVDDMRKITEDMHLSSFSPAKIIILDEFHKVSDAGQNCLLKALEDTPSHVYFVLCSSEPNKIIRGIKTRCTTVNFSKIDEGDIFDLLKDVCKKEGKKVKSDVLDKIAEICDGSARQALVLLESMIATQEGLQLDKLAEIEYGTSSAQAIDIVRAIYDYSSWKDISNILLSLKEAGADGEGLRRATLGYGVAILLKNKYNSTTAKMVDCFTNNVYDSGFNGFVSLCAKAYDCRKNTTEATF